MGDAWAKLQKCKRPIEFREGPPSLERPMSESSPLTSGYCCSSDDDIGRPPATAAVPNNPPNR